MKTKAINITQARALVRDELNGLTAVRATYRHRFGSAPSIEGEPKLRLFDYGGVPPWVPMARDRYILWREYEALVSEWKAALMAASNVAESALRAAIDSGEIVPPSPAAGRVAYYEGLPYRAGRGSVAVHALVDVATGSIIRVEVYEDTSDDI